MKLVISESQYNRIFNKKKTKIIVTESQYQKLLIENNMNKVIQNTQTGDIIKLTDKSGNELTFEVIDAFSGHILMVNKDEGVFKNAYFAFTSTGLKDGNLEYRFLQKKDVKDIDDVKNHILKDGKKSTFKNMQSFEIFESDGTTPRMELNINTGAPEPAKADDEDENVDINPEESLLEELKDNLLRMQPEQWYNFIFTDGSKMPIKSEGEEGGNVRIVEDGNLKLLAKTDSSGKLVAPKNMAEKEFQRVVSNVKFDEANDFFIDVDKSKIEEINRPKSKDETFTAKRFSIVVSLSAFNKEGKQYSTSFRINNLKSFEPIEEMESYKGSDEPGEVKIPSLGDAQLDGLIQKYLEGHNTLQSAIYKRPNKWLEALGLAKKRGIVPAEGRLAKWGQYVTKEAKKGKVLKDLPPGKKVTCEFTQLNPSSGKIMVDKKEVNLSSFVKIKEGEKFMSKVKPPRPEDEYVILGSNLESDLKLEEEFKYRIYILAELEKRDNYNIYEVEVYYKTKKYNEVAKGKLQIYTGDKENA